MEGQSQASGPTFEPPPSEQQPVAVAGLPLLRRIAPIPFAVLSLAVIFFLYQVVAGAITLIISQGKVTLDNVQLVRWSTLIGQVLFILVPTLILARLRGVATRQYFRLRALNVKDILLVLLAVFALQQMLQCYMLLQDAIPLPSPVRNIVDQVKRILEETYRVLVVSHSPGEFIFVVIVVALVPAFVEELLFRGLVQKSFEEAHGGLTAAIAAGVIFGAYHLNPLSIVPLALLGTFFGFVVYRSQNISLAILSHFFNNFVACVAAYLQFDDNFVIVSPGQAPSAQLVLTNFLLFSVVFLAATYYFARVHRQIPQVKA